MQYATLYFLTLLPFCALDAIWLTSTVGALYKPTLGDMLLPTPRLVPLIAFYLMYPVALLVFAGLPAVKAGSVTHALMYGALFGAFAYATYDLTNHATLRNWTFQLTVIDVCWGAFASGAATAIGCFATMKLNAWLAG